MNTEAKLRLQNLTVTYTNPRTRQRREVFRGLNLAVAEGEFVCLLGPSGCGKTTLLNTVAGFTSVVAGQVQVGGMPIHGPSRDRGMVFQDYGLFPWYTVEQNVQLGPRLRDASKAELEEISAHYIDLVGLRGFEHYYPHELSGGMKQRVGIARTLANRPQLLLLDEPFAALDAQTREQMQNELLRIWAHERITCLFVTHSVVEAVFLADRAIIMLPRPGRIEQDIRITMPRPRDRNSPEFVQIQRQLSDVLHQQLSVQAGD